MKACLYRVVMTLDHTVIEQLGERPWKSAALDLLEEVVLLRAVRDAFTSDAQDAVGTKRVHTGLPGVREECVRSDPEVLEDGNGVLDRLRQLFAAVFCLSASSTTFCWRCCGTSS